MLTYIRSAVLIGLLSVTALSFAALTVTEGFNYTDGSALTANGWTAHSAAGANPVTAKTTSNLTRAGATPLSGTSGASFGHRSASSEDVNRSLGAVTTADGDTIYASFLLRVDDITATNTSTEATVPFMVDGSIWPVRLYIVSNTSPTTYALGIRTHRGGGTQPVEYVNQELTTGTVHKVVLGLTFVSGAANDVAKLWLNPATGIPTPPAPDAQQAETVADSIPTLIGIRQGSSQRMTISMDDLRVSNTWTDVNPSPAAVQDWSIY